VVFVCAYLACSEIVASRAVGSETIGTNILGSNANLSLQNLAASGIRLDLIIEDTACLMVAIDMRSLESLEIWVDIFVGGWAQSSWRSLNAHNCLRDPSAAFNNSANSLGLDHISVGESNEVFIAGCSDSQICPESPTAAKLGPQSFGN
jgi:hypothetical protein